MANMKNLECSGFGSSRRRRAGLAVVAAVFGGAFACLSAQPAGAVSLWSGTGAGGVLSVDGLNISVTGCSLTLAGTTQSNCADSAGNALYQIVAVPSATGAEILIDGISGGNIFSAAAGAGAYDLKFTLSISGAGARTTVSSAAMTLVGSVNNTADNSLVSASDTITNGSGTQIGALSTNLSSLTSSTPLSSAVSSFSVTKDLNLNPSGAASGDVLGLTSVSQIFNPAPEPAAIGVFLMGLVGLGVARRKFGRSRAGSS